MCGIPPKMSAWACLRGNIANPLSTARQIRVVSNACTLSGILFSVLCTAISFRIVEKKYRPVNLSFSSRGAFLSRTVFVASKQ
jgi:hypothetical protein